MLNKVQLIGHLGDNPEVRSTQSGTAVVNVSVVTNEQWTDRQGEKQERTEWHRIVFWDKLADIVGQYLEKGSRIYVEGRIETREWEDKEGQKRWTTEIVAREMKMLGDPSGANGNGNGGQRSQQRSQHTQQRPAQQTSAPGFNEETTDLPPNEGDDLPF